MKVQRWIGLMAAVLMLHTNAKVAFAACATAAPGAMTAGASRSGGDSIPGADHGSTHHHEETSAPQQMPSSSGERSEPDDSTRGEDICQEMNSCGGYVILNQTAVRTATGLSAASAIPSNNEVLVGRAAGPEPPPPKA